MVDNSSLELAFEEDVQNNPYSMKSWWRFLEFKQGDPQKERNKLYERALRAIPGSYKLWYHYLQERIDYTKKKRKHRYKSEKWLKNYQTSVSNVNNVFERSLVFMHKMPKIWETYCAFLSQHNDITKTRHTFDRALKSLPITQHDRIWELYLKFARASNVPETTVRVFRRYLQLEPHKAEEFLEYLLSVGYVQEAAEQLLQICGDDEFVSTRDRSKLELWLELCELISKNATKIKNIDVDAVIRFGIRKFTDCVGRLWACLAEFYIRLAQFEKARDVFEEGMASVKTVRDFTLIWEGYTKFLEGLVSASVEKTESDEDDWETDADLLLLRYENLIERRALLLSSVLLRQNPHNVEEWERRARIYQKEEEVAKKLEVFSEAIATVDPMKATGKPHRLWIGYAMVYEKHGDVDHARQILKKATTVNFKSPSHLASIWLYYAELEIRHFRYDEARKLLATATKVPLRKLHHYSKVTSQSLLHKSLPLWLLRADLEESFGTYESAVDIYNQIIELKIVTPELVMTFASFCEENDRFEDAFKAYERGVNLFQFPYSAELWKTYLGKFVERYGNDNIERTRDLFEQVLEHAPNDACHVFYLMYADFEEQYGLARRAMYVYDRATRGVDETSRAVIFTIYIARARELFGVTKTREIYEKAIDVLSAKLVPDFCLKYANLETIVGEIDRARGIFTHGSQYCDPRSRADYWQKWHEFEVKHGNEDTFAEMRRIKRSVQAQYNTHVNLGLDTSNPIVDELAVLQGVAQPGKRRNDQMRALEESLTSDSSNPPLPPTKRARTENEFPAPPVPVQASNPDEIDLGDSDEEDVGAEEVEQLTVPKAVFGGLLNKEEVE
uniref:Suppressor of forked domain-containing protein n=1 Tax=Paramoeba aestuarina TaxID=180227 RepID=A0A7S4KII1_9EUKA|mmetsp:Transcript_19833/g.31080  ORF Transcript_19833/g.31080 Transcript_19833/m.31080 type:complete len:845 (+) Transcript_19833:56-2590(+)